MTPEFSRTIEVARIREGAHRIVEAAAAEREAVAARLGLAAVHHLLCAFDLQPAGTGTVQANGKLRARITQTCVISLEPFETEIAEDFQVRFVPGGAESDEFDLEADDEIPYYGQRARSWRSRRRTACPGARAVPPQTGRHAAGSAGGSHRPVRRARTVAGAVGGRPGLCPGPAGAVGPRPPLLGQGTEPLAFLQRPPTSARAPRSFEFIFCSPNMCGSDTGDHHGRTEAENLAQPAGHAPQPRGVGHRGPHRMQQLRRAEAATSCVRPLRPLRWP